MDGKVDVVGVHVVAQVHLGVGLTHPEDTFDVTHSNGNTAYLRALLSDFCVEACHLIFVDVVKSGVDVLFGVDDIFFEQVLGHEL